MVTSLWWWRSFCEYTANVLSKKFDIDIYYYSLDEKIHKKLKFKKY